MRTKTSFLTLAALVGTLGLGGCFMAIPTAPDDDTEEEGRGGDDDGDSTGNFTARVIFAGFDTPGVGGS